MFNRTSLLAALSFTLLIVGCGGGANKSIDTPKSKSYGVFRALKPKAPPTLKEQSSVKSVAPDVITMSSRANHRSILMMNGKVLIAGGDANSYHPTMDIYDPNTETFSQSAAIPRVSRHNKYSSGSSYDCFGMCNLPDGKVVIFGFSGSAPIGADYTCGDIYDPITDTLTPIPFAFNLAMDDIYYVGNNKVLAFPSGWPTPIIVNLLTGEYEFSDVRPGRKSLPNNVTVQDSNGNIWAIAGLTPDDYHNTPVSQSTVFMFDPTTSQWTQKANLLVKRHDCSAVLLPGNKIGIYGGNTIEQTDPTDVRVGASTKLTKLLSTEIYDIASNTSSLSTELVGIRSKTEAIYLQTGYTLIAGGLDNESDAVDSELIHNHSLSFSGSTGNMLVPRVGHYLNNLPNGLVLVTGGIGSAGVTAEIFDPKSALYVKYVSEQVVVGNTMQLTAYNDLGTEVSPVWSTANNTFGSVDSTGKLTTIATGIVEITATLGDVKATVRITVIPE